MPHVFTNSLIAPERLVRSGRGKCHSTQFNDGKMAKSITSVTVFTFLLVVLERLNRFGPEQLCSSWIDNSNDFWSNVTCFVPRGTFLWHVTRVLTNLLFAVEALIRFCPDRRRSTQANDGNMIGSMPGCSRTDELPRASDE